MACTRSLSTLAPRAEYIYSLAVRMVSGFVRLPASGLRCCERRAIFTQHGGAFEQYGQPVGQQTRNITLRACIARCRLTSHCTFLSRSDAGHCVLCLACELRRSFDGSNYTSWALRDAYSPFTRVAPATLSDGILQGNYSIALYGATGRVDTQALRIVWLQLLPPAFVSAVATSTGFCKASPMPPLRPFFLSMDVTANPQDALWVHAPHATPIPSHQWTEVTHCPQRLHSDPGGAAWKAMPMWLYVAPGSGVSINVGRTLALESFAEAAHVLARAFSGKLAGHASILPRACSDEFAFAPPHFEGRGLPWRQGGPTAVTQHILRRAIARLDRLNLSGLDSIQILQHQEYFSREPRHELVFLRRSECQTLRPSWTEIKCGRAPWLRTCSQEDAALRRLSTCGRQSLSAALKRLVGPRTNSICKNTSCFADGRGSFEC